MSSHDDLEDDQEYDLDYSEDGNSEPDVDLENQYYNSKSLKEHNTQASLQEFEKVLELERAGEKGEWGFRALKQMVKLHFRLGDFDSMMSRYRQLLSYIRAAVTRNYSERSINSILDYVSCATSSSHASTRPSHVLQAVCETTLEALTREASNERLWFKTSTKLARLCFERGEHARVQTILKQLHAACRPQSTSLGGAQSTAPTAPSSSSVDDVKRGTQLLEVYALEMQLHSDQKNSRQVKAVYEKALHVRASSIAHPLIMGYIRECGGKVHLREHQFEQAHTDFFEAFKNYDESGSPRRIACLKYLVLANMLTQSTINPFDSQEAKPYRDDAEIVAMTSLVRAYQDRDVHHFERILRANHSSIMEDAFVREHIEELLRNIRTQVLIKMVRPYTRVRVDYLAASLNVDEAEVERLLVTCILDGHLSGARIDEVAGVLDLTSSAPGACEEGRGSPVTGPPSVDYTQLGVRRYKALNSWIDQVACIHASVVNRML